MTSVYVIQCHRTEWHENERSGHIWPEYIPVKQWEVVEPRGRRKFNSEKKADKYAVEAEAFHKKFPFTPPRTPRELSYLTSLRERGLQ